MRVDKFISNNTVYSRKDIKRLMKAGKVTVNGEVIKDCGHHISDSDEVVMHDQVITPRQPRYFMLHKPADVVSASHDEEHMTALDLLEEPFFDELHIAGRLDIDTTGLLLITDDGKWSQKITSPKYKIPKVYLVETAEPISAETATRFQQGIYLEKEDITTQPAELELLDPQRARLTIHEGKYHQVKRMFHAVGNEVTALHRERIGDIVLDAELEPGEYRHLTAEEIALD